MRYIKDIPHTQFKAGLYQWNGKYIIKFEAGGRYEQIFKLDETDFADSVEVERMLDGPFIEALAVQFGRMHEATLEALHRHGILY